LWLKEVAPSTELRRWLGHDAAEWKPPQVRYRRELRDSKDALELLKRKAQKHTVILLDGVRSEEHNEALVLKGVVEERKR
jgi:uncharacterized protein YeaO (DUF488 family)